MPAPVAVGVAVGAPGARSSRAAVTEKNVRNARKFIMMAP